MWRLPQKHGYCPKPEFYRRGFLKFDRLVLARNVLVGSENRLVRLSYNQESIPNVVYIFGIFMCSEMKEIQCLTIPQSHVWTLPQKQIIVQKRIIYYFILTLVDSFYDSYLLRNTVEKCKMHSQS